MAISSIISCRRDVVTGVTRVNLTYGDLGWRRVAPSTPVRFLCQMVEEYKIFAKSQKFEQRLFRGYV